MKGRIEIQACIPDENDAYEISIDSTNENGIWDQLIAIVLGWADPMEVK